MPDSKGRAAERPTATIAKDRRSRLAGFAVVGVIVLLVLALIGVAHWRVHDLQTGDLVWDTETSETPTDEDNVLIVDDRVYLFEYEDLTILDRRTGDVIAAEYVPETSRGYVGVGGHIAVAGLDTVAFFTKDGRRLWQKNNSDLRPIAISPAGVLEAVECLDRKPCVDVRIDTTGRETRRPSSVSKGAGVTIDNGTDEVLEASGRDLVRLPTLPITVSKRLAYQLRDGKPFGKPVHTLNRDNTVAQVGDLLIGLSRSGSTCTFEAVRSGNPAWTTSTDCPELDSPHLDVHADRLTVTEHHDPDNGGGDNVIEVVTTDLAGHRATSFTVDTRRPLKHTQLRAWPTPDAVVVADIDRLSAYSLTGKLLWRDDLPCEYIESMDGSRRWKSCEHVHVSGDRIIRTTENDGTFWSALAIGRDVPSETLDFFDPNSGETAARLSPGGASTMYGTGVYATDVGDAVVLSDELIWLVRQ